LLSAVILQSTGKQADVFAAEQLFEPLGIKAWDWENNKYEGQPDMSGTLKLRPRDMAKLGQLILNKGSWDGEQVVPAVWIYESTRVHYYPPDVDEYGYLWWGYDQPEPEGIDFAMGIGSQYILILPGYQMVVVVTGGNEWNGKEPAILEVGRQYLLSGMHR